MASLRNHEIVETYRSVMDPNNVYHVTKNDRVVRTTGPRGGNAKLLFVSDKGVFNFSGMGRRATATEFRPRLEKMERMPKTCDACDGRGTRQDFSTSMDNFLTCKKCNGTGKIQ